jgi:hypothetical protein
MMLTPPRAMDPFSVRRSNTAEASALVSLTGGANSASCPALCPITPLARTRGLLSFCRRVNLPS